MMLIVQLYQTFKCMSILFYVYRYRMKLRAEWLVKMVVLILCIHDSFVYNDSKFRKMFAALNSNHIVTCHHIGRQIIDTTKWKQSQCAVIAVLRCTLLQQKGPFWASRKEVGGHTMKPKRSVAQKFCLGAITNAIIPMLGPYLRPRNANTCREWN